MPSSRWIRAIIVLAMGSLLALSALTGDSLDQKHVLKWLSMITSAITLLLFAFDRWIWRWPGFRTLSELAGARVINGTWRGTLKYNRDREGNPGEQPIYMVVKQTYSNIKICSYFPTKDSHSESLTAAMEAGPTNHVLRYIYRQQAPFADRETNPPTEGACELTVVSRPVDEIHGSYYVERNGGKGKISFDGFSPKVVGSAAAAQRLTFKDLP